MDDVTTGGDSRTKDQTPPGQQLGWLPEMRAGLSGVLLWSAFPPQGMWWLAWVALIPWFGVFVDQPNLSLRRMLRVGMFGGLAFWVPAIQWVRLSDPSAWVGWLVMALALGVWWPIMTLMVLRLYRRNGWPLWAAWVATWGFQEIAREYYMTGFPWYHLAHSQFRQTWLIQYADIVGSSGLSLIMVGVQALAAEWFFGGRWGWRAGPRHWRAGLTAICITLGLNLVYGQVRLNTARFEPGPRLALLQSDVPQSRRLYPEHDKLLEVYRVLIQKALATKEPLDLIVWPETSFPYPLIVMDKSLDEQGIKRVLGEMLPKEMIEDWYTNRNEAHSLMNEWTGQANVAMLVGATAWDLGPAGFRKFNTAGLFEPGQAGQFYYKMHLVPFGEYIPWTEYVPLIADLAPFPPDQRPNLRHGEKPLLLTLKGKWTMAPLICFEDTVPHVVRRFFNSTEKDTRVDFLLNLSNDGWFRGSEEHEVHLAASVFRCVETRTPMVRAVNTGISGIIDSNGTITHEAPKATESVIVDQVPLDNRFSLYCLVGDLSGMLSSIACLTGWFWRWKKTT